MIFENNKSLRNALMGSVSASALLAAYALPNRSASAAELSGAAITAQDQTAGLTESTGGAQAVVFNATGNTINVGSNTAAAVAVTGGSQLTINITNSGSAQAVNFIGDITTGTATDTLTINSTTGDPLTFQGNITEGSNVNAITINIGSSAANATHAITFDTTNNEDLAIAAAISAVDATDTVNITVQSSEANDGHTITFSDAIGGSVAANAVDAIVVDSSAKNAAITANFGSTVNTGTFTVSADDTQNKAATATITGNLTASGAVTVTGNNDADASLTLAGAVISAGSFSLDKDTGDATLTIAGSANQSVTGTINGAGGNEGILAINGNSVIFNSAIGGNNALVDINIGATSTATQAIFRANVTSQDFTLGTSAAVNVQMIVQNATDGSDITITGPVDIGNAGSNAAIIVIDSSSTTADTVTFANTVSAATAGIDLIAIGSSTLGGNAIFSNTVGNSNAVANIVITGGDAAAEDSTATFSGADVTAGAITLNDNAGSTTLTFNNASSAVIGTIDGASAGEGTLVINTATTGTFNSNVGSIASLGAINIGTTDTANSVVVFNNTNVNATAITLGNSGSNADSVTVTFRSGAANKTIAGEINAITGETGTNKIHVDDGDAGIAAQTVAFSGNVGATTTLDVLNVGSATTAGIATFAGTVNAAAITVTAGNQANEASSATFAGALNATTLTIVGAANGTGTVSIAGNLTTSGNITLNKDTAQGVLNLTGASQTVSGVIEGAAADEGSVNISGTGVSISSNIGGTNRLGTIDITSTGNVTVTSAMIMDATLVKLSGGTLNLNATLTSDDGASVWNFGGASGGTIVIGRPVASFTNSVVINASAATTTLDAGSNTVAVTPHVGFTSGSLTLVKGNTATKNALVAADFTANNTALTEYTFAKSGSDITMTASSKSAAETAAAIGVSAVEAQALGSAVAATVGDASVTAAFNTALTTGGAEAQKAAKQSQPDPGALSAASSASSSSGAASFSAVGTRLASLRETRNLAYASGDASLGFAAGSGPLSEAVWLKPLISHATQELRSGIEGFDTTTRGMAFGIDTEMDEGTRVGLYGSFTVTNVEGDGVQDANTNITQQSVGVYGDYTADGFYVEGMVGYARNDVESDRLIDFGGLSPIRAQGQFTSNQYQARVGAGTPVNAGGWFVTPNASLSYTNVKGEAFTETNAGVLNLTVDQDDVKAVIGQIGLKIHTNVKQDGGGTLTPELRGSYMRDFAGDEATSTANFANGAGTAFTTTGADVAENSYTGGLGLTYSEGNMSLGVTYDYVGKANYQGHNGSISARWKF